MLAKRQETNRHRKGTWKTRMRPVPRPEARARSYALDPLHRGLPPESCSCQLRTVSYQHFSARGSAPGAAELVANCDRFKMMKLSSSRMYAFTEQGIRGAMRQVHEDHLRNLPRPFHHRRSEGNLLDGRLAEGRGTADLRRRENGCGGHSGASRINPQGDIGTAGIRQGEVNGA